MKKKILFGSIIAVVLLTLVSFSSVVGYSSVKSDSNIASPLFGIRTNRAINKEQDAVTSDYIGKGKAINILLPRRSDKAELVEKFVNIIKGMDDKTFDKFVKRFIAYFNQNNLDNVKVSNEEIKDMLFQIKGNPDIIKSIFKDISMNTPTSDGYCRFTTDGNFCFILGLIFLTLLLILVIATSFISIFLGIMMTIE